MKSKKWLEFYLMVAWVAGTILLSWLLEQLFDSTHLDAWALIALGLGLFSLIHHPLSKRGFPQYFEAGSGVILIGTFILYYGMVVIGPRLSEELADDTPCSPKTMEARCYRLTPSACQMVWTHYNSECQEEAARQYRGTTRLVGAGVYRCAQKRMNKYMSFNQKNLEGSGCAAYFQKLKD
jgi:hypothetical protein